MNNSIRQVYSSVQSVACIYFNNRAALPKVFRRINLHSHIIYHYHAERNAIFEITEAFNFFCCFQ